MLSVKIHDPEKLTALLLEEEAFDRFIVLSAQVHADLLFTMDGRPADGSELKPVLWRTVREPFSALVHAGGEVRSMKLVLKTSEGSTRFIQEQSGFRDCPVSSFSMNFTKKEDGTVTVSAGVSYHGFSLDKSAERYWDSQVESFLRSRGIGFAASEEA